MQPAAATPPPAAGAEQPLRLTVLTTGPGALEVVPALGERSWMTDTAEQFAYRCQPMAAANLQGWHVIAAHGFMAAWNGGAKPEDLLIRGEPGLVGVHSRYGNGILSIDPFCVLRTDPGVDLLVTGPVNAPKDGVAALTGLIEADWLPLGLQIHFVFTRPGSVRFRRGEPLAQIFPIVRGLAERIVLERRNAAAEPALAAAMAEYSDGRRFLDPAPAPVQPAPVPAPVPTPVTAPADAPATPAIVRGADAVQTLAAAGIYCEEGFLAETACAALRDCFARQTGRLIKLPDGNRFFDNRVLWHDSLPESESACKNLMVAARRAIKERMRRFYAIPGLIYSDTIQLVKWEGGQPMQPHADAEHPDGSAHTTPHRAFAALVYLNDDYEGGLIYFPRQQIQIKPRSGLLLCFRGDLAHMHGVTEVTRGVRYTMPSWYTHDIRFREASDT